jgi:hypothetical protein
LIAARIVSFMAMCAVVDLLRKSSRKSSLGSFCSKRSFFCDAALAGASADGIGDEEKEEVEEVAVFLDIGVDCMAKTSSRVYVLKYARLCLFTRVSIARRMGVASDDREHALDASVAEAAAVAAAAGGEAEALDEGESLSESARMPASAVAELLSMVELPPPPPSRAPPKRKGVPFANGFFRLSLSSCIPGDVDDDGEGDDNGDGNGDGDFILTFPVLAFFFD